MSARVSVGASALLYLSFALVGCGQPAKSAEKSLPQRTTYLVCDPGSAASFQAGDKNNLNHFTRV